MKHTKNLIIGLVVMAGALALSSNSFAQEQKMRTRLFLSHKNFLNPEKDFLKDVILKPSQIENGLEAIMKDANKNRAYLTDVEEASYVDGELAYLLLSATRSKEASTSKRYKDKDYQEAIEKIKAQKEIIFQKRQELQIAAREEDEKRALSDQDIEEIIELHNEIASYPLDKARSVVHSLKSEQEQLLSGIRSYEVLDRAQRDAMLRALVNNTESVARVMVNHQDLDKEFSEDSQYFKRNQQLDNIPTFASVSAR